MATRTPSEIRTAWLLFIAAIVFWGVNWPIMKIGLTYIGPLWFSTIRALVAVVALFIFLGAIGKLSWPKRDEIPVLLSLGIGQSGIFMALIHVSLLFVEAGRSSVLAYTTPIWVVPLAYVFLGETMTKRKAVGLAVGVGGLMVLFNPLTFPWGLNGYTLGNGLLILAAVIWAAVIVHVRGHGWSRPHLSIIPWQFLMGAAVQCITAFAIEGTPVVPTTWDFAAIMGFNGIVATAFSFWAFIHTARILPASSTAMGSLGVPAVGLVSSVLILGETISITMACVPTRGVRSARRGLGRRERERPKAMPPSVGVNEAVTACLR